MPARQASRPHSAKPAVLLLRAPAAAEKTAEKLRQTGFQPIILAPSRIEPLAWAMPQGCCSMWLAASANAFLSLPALTKAQLAAPLYCVGTATAKAAAQCGFTTIACIAENAAALCRALEAKPLPAGAGSFALYLAGAARRPEIENFLRARAVPHHIIVTYQSRACPLAPAQIAALPPCLSAVLLYSAAQAAHLPALAAHIGAQTRILCLSPRIAAAVPLAFRAQAQSAAQPNETELLALLP